MSRAAKAALAAFVTALAAPSLHAQGADTDPDAFDGSYLANPTADCSLGAVEGGALSIEAAEFTGVGARCDMQNPVNVRDMEAVLFDMACEGGDDTWTDRAMLMRAADGGLIMVWDGYAMKYDRCPADPASGTVTSATDVGVTDEVE